jgi:hypothetical protein
MESDRRFDADFAPEDALAAVNAGWAGLADRLVTPWWYHPILGVLLGVMVAAPALESSLAAGVAWAVGGGGVAVLAGAYRNMTGVGLDSWRGLPPNPWYLATVGAFFGALALGIALDGAGRPWGPVLAGVLLLPAVVVLGRRGDVLLRDQLRTPA